MKIDNEFELNFKSIPCANKKFECCPDGITAAQVKINYWITKLKLLLIDNIIKLIKGPNFQGCKEDSTHIVHKYLDNSESNFIIDWLC